ncbi:MULTISPECIES: MarR family winged helix-turn-helix transcriptional regulator [Terribacillus]|uniref:DNA-binding transcriptional regulator, MarR family n=1 Tax=Terribacillus saccharophilus TaxID=361277 RepID=A0A1H8IUL5_9BACI|nr:MULTISPECIES: MarR family transcriptional regulator [Terribacillus]MCM3227166.1 MarR family transcriptional regulator [Terribacillus saccharophilus]MEC0284171.1 MarR family transcriptional regulator [Terribacillus saccharophilus]MEC0289717.1 MarR family transcriptional regulator [Terribacillus saccharophilus]MEC0301527.1 MarR family transcriptional regulator [Terribacillus saccharophilus]PAD34476.1 MarR family transcriptional regulator [Terribacillus saccharophilus]
MESRDMVDFIELVRNVNKALRKEWDFQISGPQLVLLRLLKNNGPMRMSDLAEEVGISFSGATNLGNRMIKEGYLERIHSEKDRRVVMLAITQKGSDFYVSFSGARDKAFGSFLDKLTEEEKNEFIRLSRKMLAD